MPGPPWPEQLLRSRKLSSFVHLFSVELVCAVATAYPSMSSAADSLSDARFRGRDAAIFIPALYIYISNTSVFESNLSKASCLPRKGGAILALASSRAGVVQ